MIIHCRRCDCNYKVPDSLAGAQAPCPECGATNKITNMEVIDVEYEVQADAPPEIEFSGGQPDEDTLDAVLTDEDSTGREPPWDTQRSYTVYVQRQMENSGLPCCSVGCLIFFILSFLLVRGCMSVLS